MFHYSVAVWKFSTLLLLTAFFFLFFTFCPVAECVTVERGDRRAYLLNGPQADGRLSPTVESLFAFIPHTDTNIEINSSRESDKCSPSSLLPALPAWVFPLPDLSLKYRVQRCLRMQWQHGLGGFVLGSCAYFMNCCFAALWILSEGSQTEDKVGGGRWKESLKGGVRLGCVTSVLMIKRTSSG